MSTYSEYPVFEPNQVLSYTHLNGLVDYLEKQDRLTRRKLIGIGIACGLKVNWKTSEEVLYISKGVAVTSEGYLISLEENFYDKFIPYSLPELSMEESGDGEIEETLYPFFHDDDGNEIEMWELLPTTFVPEEGEESPETLTEGFLEGKVILLYLETERESMRNCDINDCSDKGAKMTFDVRVLAINEADAIAILDMEEEIANRPVHQNKHPKFDLTHLDIEKINPARHELKNFQEIYLRIVEIVAKLNPTLTTALSDSFEAYKYLLTDVYPEADFPSGPFNDLNTHFSNVNNDFIQNILSLQYVYDFYYDIVQGYNEFTHYAHQLNAECSPSEERFPKHVLLGKALHHTSAFVPAAIGNTFDPFSAQTGYAPPTKPLAYRHYFIPSPIFGGQCELLNKVRSIHYRLYLSAYRYDTAVMSGNSIRITPSKDGDYFLSDKAVPFYYAFNNADDFHANWSFDKTVKNKLNRVLSYQFIQDATHPLLNKMDDHNFYRIEGHVGQGLATVLKNLGAQKRSLGLSFAIEPIFIGVTGDQVADAQAIRDLMSAARRLFMCKMRDLDVIFLILIAILFYMLFVLLALLSRVGRGAFFLQGASIGTAASLEAHQPISAEKTSSDFINKRIIRQDSDQVLKKIRNTKGYTKGTVVRELNKEQGPDEIGNMYLEINAESSASNLYERTYQVVKRKGDKATDVKRATEDIYPAIALMDSTEEVMKSLSTESIVEFDFELFESRYGNFVNAYENFTTQNPSPVLEQNVNYKEAKEYAVQNQAPLANPNTQAMLSNLSSEFGERFLSMLSELTLAGYAKKHPGMEHKAGVPKGGTFIPIYAHRDFVSEELRKLVAGFAPASGSIYNVNEAAFNETIHGLNLSYSAASNPMAINAGSNNTLTNAAGSNDPLDNFIVLGDFCIPTLCCDGDCSDIFEEEVRPTKGTVTGNITELEKGTIIRHAKVTAVNISTNKETETAVDRNGHYKLELDPAGYRISAMATGFITSSETKTISAGNSITLPFKLQHEQYNYRRIPEIENGTAGYEVNSNAGKEAMRYYGSRYAYYDGYALKMDADASTDTDKKLADQVRSSMETIMSPETDLTKLNREIKRVNNALVKVLETSEDDSTKRKVNESIKVINSAYLDKLSLISADSVTAATKNTLDEIEKTNKNSEVSISKSVKEWVAGHNISSKPKIVDGLRKLKIKKDNK